jgi:hypothetical protein
MCQRRNLELHVAVRVLIVEFLQQGRGDADALDDKRGRAPVWSTAGSRRRGLQLRRWPAVRDPQIRIFRPSRRLFR